MEFRNTLAFALLGLASLAANPTLAQTGLGVGTLNPDASAALDITSSNQGLLVPRVALTGATDATTIANPANGLTVFNTSASGTLPLGLVSNLGTSSAPNWQPAGAGLNWSVKGNANAAPSTSFLGTTDNQPLVFRTNNAEVGRFLTSGALWLSPTKSNMLVGYQAGQAITRGSYNTLLGYQAGQATTTAEGNTFVGYQTGYFNTTGADNVAIGNQAGYANTTGRQNISIGTGAGAQNTSGISNISIGHLAGVQSQGSNNLFMGFYSGMANMSGYRNMFIGDLSGYNNVSGNQNVFVGYGAGAANTTGNNNTALGYQAAYNTKTGANNYASGNNAGWGNNTGSSNTFLGYSAGWEFNGNYGNTSGSRNTFIGYQANLVSSRQHTNAAAIGYKAKVDQDNSLVLGGTDSLAVRVGIGTTTPGEALTVVGNILASGTITQNSDRRLKTNVRPLSGALASVGRLRGVRYEFLAGKGPTGEQVGVIAQEIEQVYPELVRTDAVTGIKSVNYAQLTPVLLEAIKELQAQLAAAKSEASQLRQEQAQTTASIEAINARLHLLEGAISVPTVAR